jgi:hypothetical protein
LTCLTVFCFVSSSMMSFPSTISRRRCIHRRSHVIILTNCLRIVYPVSVFFSYLLTYSSSHPINCCRHVIPEANLSAAALTHTWPSYQLLQSVYPGRKHTRIGSHPQIAVLSAAAVSLSRTETYSQLLSPTHGHPISRCSKVIPSGNIPASQNYLKCGKFARCQAVR